MQRTYVLLSINLGLELVPEPESIQGVPSNLYTTNFGRIRLFSCFVLFFLYCFLISFHILSRLLSYSKLLQKFLFLSLFLFFTSSPSANRWIVFPELSTDISIKSVDPNAFSVLHLNIRIMKKSVQNFKEFLINLSVSFSAICLSKTWSESLQESQNLSYILSVYKFFISIGYIAEEEVSFIFWEHRFDAKLDFERHHPE